jgi:hypothetical protein
MIEIVIEGENLDVLAGEMRSYLETIINLINTINASSELGNCIETFISRIKKVRSEVLGSPQESMAFH